MMSPQRYGTLWHHYRTFATPLTNRLSYKWTANHQSLNDRAPGNPSATSRCLDHSGPLPQAEMCVACHWASLGKRASWVNRCNWMYESLAACDEQKKKKNDHTGTIWYETPNIERVCCWCDITGSQHCQQHKNCLSVKLRHRSAKVARSSRQQIISWTHHLASMPDPLNHPPNTPCDTF